jgi:hypothetical protein
MIMSKEDLKRKFYERYTTIEIETNDETLDRLLEQRRNFKISIRCKKCSHIWQQKIQALLEYTTSCYKCMKNKGYSVDEIKILQHIKEKYISAKEQIFFRYGKNQLVINLSSTQKPDYLPFLPSCYRVDGYSRFVYKYDSETKQLLREYNSKLKGTIFEILGDYYHSNPEYYEGYEKPEFLTRILKTHKENYEYTMGRIRHLEELGYRVFYIWVSDFRKYTRDLQTDITVNIFDYMNKIKTSDNYGKVDITLLSRNSQQIYRERQMISFC